MKWIKSQHVEVHPGWLKGLQRRTNIKELFCYYDKAHDVYFLAVWQTPQQRHKEYSMVECFGNTHPSSAPCPDVDDVASKASFFEDIRKRVLSSAREKKRELLKAKIRAKENAADIAKWLRKKDLKHTAGLVEQGVIPLSDPEGKDLPNEAT